MYRQLILRLLILLLGSSSMLLAHAQSRSHTMFGATIKVSELPNQKISSQLHFNPLRFMGVTLSYGLKGTQERQGDLTRELEEQVLGGQLRIFPFGAAKLFNAGKFFRHGFRSKANFEDSWAQTYLSGLYLGLGYEHRRATLLFTPDASLNSPWEDFHYDITDAGPLGELGYSIVVNHLYLSVAYRWRFSQPQWQGPVDIFGDDLYTKTYPTNYRQTNGIQLSVGAAF